MQCLHFDHAEMRPRFPHRSTCGKYSTAEHCTSRVLSPGCYTVWGYMCLFISVHYFTQGLLTQEHWSGKCNSHAVENSGCQNNVTTQSLKKALHRHDTILVHTEPTTSGVVHTYTRRGVFSFCYFCYHFFCRDVVRACVLHRYHFQRGC